MLFCFAGCDGDGLVFPTENTPTRAIIDAASWREYEANYAQLIGKSDHIVCVDVLEGLREQEIVESDRLVKTGVIRCFAQVQVREVLKGDLQKNDVFYVQENGHGTQDENGSIWGTAKTACGGLVMEQGNRVVLFLVDSDMTTDSGKPLYEMASQLFGKFFYDADGKYHASISYNENYADYLERDICLDDNEPKTLRDFKKMIAEVQ